MKTKILKFVRDNFFIRELLIKKIIIFMCATIIVLTFSLSFFFVFKNLSDENIPFGKNNFLYFRIKWNEGIAFSKLKNNFFAIYLIQTLFIVFLIIYLFFSKNIWAIVFLSFAICGGLFNLLQRRFHDENKVLDYFCFGFFNFPIFNFPDIFIVLSFIGFTINNIINLSGSIKDDYQNKKPNQQNSSR